MSRTNKTLGLRNFEKDAERLRVLMGGGTTYLPPSAGGEMFNRIVVYHASGAPAQFFPVNDAGLAAAIVAVTGADTITIPPCIFANDYTLPANTSVLGTGSLVTKFSGTVTCGSNTYLRDVGIMRSVSSGSEIVGLLGPTTGEAYLNTVNINQANSGAGAATGIKMQAGNLKVRGSYSRGSATGGGLGYAVIGHATARFEFDEGCSFVGSTAKFSGGNIYAYNTQNEIRQLDAAGELVRTYSASQAGLIAGLAAAASGDRLELPQDTIDLATGISVPAGVTISGQGGYGSLNFSAFAGTAIILDAGSSLQKLSINYDATGQANALGISASGDGWLVQLCSVYIHGASGNNYGGEFSGATPVKGFIEFSHLHGNGGSNAHGIRILSGGNVAVSYSTGLGRNGSSTSYGLSNATGASGNESWIEFSRFDGDTAGSKIGAVNSGYGAFFSNIFSGATAGFSNSGTARVCDNHWTSQTGAGTITYLQGDRGAYNEETWHASDIENSYLQRHLPKPAADGTDDTKIAVVQGTQWVMGDPSANSPVVVDYSTVNVDNPPTKEQIDTAFGTPGVVGAGFLGIINDNAAALNQYLCASDGFNWLYMNLTKAIATVAAAIAILAGDTFTGSNGTHLNAHTMDEGSGWTENSGSWAISSNAAVQATNAGAQYIATTDTGDANTRIRARVKPSAASGLHIGGLIGRFSDTSNYWRADITTGGTPLVRLWEMNGGVQTLRASKAWTNRYQKYVDLEMTLDGNIISVTVDGGYGITYTSSFNNTATKHGITEYRDNTTPVQACVFEDFQVVDLPVYPWTRLGDVLTAGTGEGQNVLEASVIYEGNAKILTGNVFKMWYTAGYGTWADIGIRYAESTTGLPGSWTKYGSNPLITHYARSSVFKDGGTYYMYASYEDTRLDLLTSTDGLAWTLDTSNVLPLGGAGAWDDQHIVNTFVWKEGPTDWRMMYEGNHGGSFWHLGYATSTDGRTWTKSGSNPVLNLDGGTGGPFVKKVGSYYYLFTHKAPQDLQVPTNLYRYRSTDLVNWTPYPMSAELVRIGADQGEDNYVGQLGDPFIVEANGLAYFFFSATSDGTQQSGNTHIEVATADPRAIYEW